MIKESLPENAWGETSYFPKLKDPRGEESENTAFIISQGSSLNAVLDNLMKEMDAQLKKVKGYNAHPLFPVAVTDDGGSYYAYQQWKWYTRIPNEENKNV